MVEEGEAGKLDSLVFRAIQDGLRKNGLTVDDLRY
jgi:hypothetical protein